LSGVRGLGDLPRIRDSKRRRISSHDVTGGNVDFFNVPAGETFTLAEISGAGCINHIWITLGSEDKWHLRNLVLRMYWDGEENPSVEVPLGDFFGLGHGVYKNFTSAPLQMAPEDGKSLNSWWAMPFSDGARIEVENQGSIELDRIYYYVDYEEYESLDEDVGRFHASWNRVNTTQGIDYEKPFVIDELKLVKNPEGEGNYVILEAEGRGHYVGCNFNHHNLLVTDKFNWYGEGDDMIFIDGEKLPSIVGSGTEDYYNMAWCPTQEYQGAYYGLLLPGDENWHGKISWYRYHVLDPIHFKESIRVTIEVGHNNWRTDDVSSTAYWYQLEPHKPFRALPPAAEREPRDSP
jgi:hypothetical protein